MEQVLTGPDDRPAIIATTALESTPPDRNAPSGTSEIMRSFTDSFSRATSSSQASASPIDACAPLLFSKRTSQYSRGAGIGWPRRIASVCAGGSLYTSLEHGPRLGHVAEREVLLDRLGLDDADQVRMREQRLQLGAEQQHPVGQDREVHRLDAESVAREEQRLAIAIPQREREHAAKARDARLAPFLPRVHDDLGVAARAERMPAGGQLDDEFLIVVDLAVEHDGDSLVLVVERLVAAAEVDDRQAAMPEPDPGFEVEPVVVGTAMRDRVVHRDEEAARDVAARARVEDAADSAHGTTR